MGKRAGSKAGGGGGGGGKGKSISGSGGSNASQAQTNLTAQERQIAESISSQLNQIPEAQRAATKQQLLSAVNKKIDELEKSLAESVRAMKTAKRDDKWQHQSDISGLETLLDKQRSNKRALESI